jgi:transaldolase
MAMKIFLDTADLAQIREALSWGICDGVTTNPSITLQCGVRGAHALRDHALEIVSLLGDRPLSLEVTTDEPRAALKEAYQLRSWAPNIVVKVTITDRNGGSLLPVIRELSAEGIPVNVTAMMTFNQAVLAAKTGARYLSLFGGRIDDEGADATAIIAAVRRWLDLWDYPGEIIVGSSRTRMNLQDWACAGAHILTITPVLVRQMLTNARTKETVAQFLTDAEKALRMAADIAITNGASAAGREKDDAEADGALVLR